MFHLELEGMLELTQALQRLATQAQAAMVQAVQQEAERILEASIPLVPVDTGLLVSTGMVEENLDGADIRYGGHGLAPYAVIVHEDTQMHHPHGGQHHYLSQPFFEATGDMPARLAAAVAPRLR